MSNLRSSNQPLNHRTLGKTETKHCKMTFRLDLDIGPRKMERTVEFNSILAR